jgi:hypothetical protein
MKDLIFNRTDGVYAHPDAVSRAEGKRIIERLKQRYRLQGYYASVKGRIPISMLELILIPAR